MKRLCYIAISLLLVVSTMGITINRHYSNGKLFSSSLFSKPVSCCTTDNCNCCNEESDVIKVTDDFMGSHFEFPKVFFTDLLQTITEGVDSYALDPEIDNTYYLSNKIPLYPPPGEESLQVFLL